MWLVFGHEHIAGGITGGNRRLQSTLAGEGKPSRADLAWFDEVVKTLHENSEDDKKDGPSRCPLGVGFQRRELKKGLLRWMKEIQFGGTSSLVLFISANCTGNISRGDSSTGQGQTAEYD